MSRHPDHTYHPDRGRRHDENGQGNHRKTNRPTKKARMSHSGHRLIKSNLFQTFQTSFDLCRSMQGDLQQDIGSSRRVFIPTKSDLMFPRSKVFSKKKLMILIREAGRWFFPLSFYRNTPSVFSGTGEALTARSGNHFDQQPMCGTKCIYHQDANTKYVRYPEAQKESSSTDSRSQLFRRHVRPYPKIRLHQQDQQLVG